MHLKAPWLCNFPKSILFILLVPKCTEMISIYQWNNEDKLSGEACSYRLSEKEIKECLSSFSLAKWSWKDFIHSISARMNEMIFWAYEKEQQLHKVMYRRKEQELRFYK